MNSLAVLAIILAYQTNSAQSYPTGMVGYDCGQGLPCHLALYQGPCGPGQVIVQRQDGPVCESTGDITDQNEDGPHMETVHSELPLSVLTKV